MAIKQRLYATTHSGDLTNVLCDGCGQVVTEDVGVHCNHLGNAFLLSAAIDDLDTDHSYDVLIQTGDLELHVKLLEAQVSGAAHGYFFENTEVESVGDTLTPICLNRTIAGSSTATFTGGSTETSGMSITDTGDLLITTHFAADIKKSAGGQQDLGMPLILAANTNYLLKIDNEAGEDNQVSVFLSWTEHEE